MNASALWNFHLTFSHKTFRDMEGSKTKLHQNFFKTEQRLDKAGGGILKWTSLNRSLVLATRCQ